MIDQPSKPSSHPYTMLAVDDERANLNLLKRTFRGEFNILTAGNGLEGLELLKVNPVDIIITDQRMPQMSGVEMLVHSRKLAPDAVRIILTAYTDVRDIIASINQGHVYRYIIKPWSPDELKLTVRQAMEYYQLNNENRRLVVELRRSLNDLKAAQALLIERERLSTLGRVASSIIHDLKLPMANIRAAASLLARDHLDKPTRDEFGRMITREVDRLVEMTREILDFARGETQLKIEEFSLDSLLAEVCELVKEDFKRSRVRIIRSWTELGSVKGDASRLRRVLLNLMVNARDAMPKGGDITISGSRANNNIEIKVSDQGTGIPEAILSNIFEPFVSLGKHEGTGLGLSIARRIVESHNGSIKAQNRPEGGAEFIINLPIIKE